MIQKTFGDPRPAPVELAKAARITFAPEFPLKWDDCSTSANFISHYYAGVLAEQRTPDEVRDIAHSIAYMVNELVENVVKFRVEGPVEIAAGLVDGEFMLRIVNKISTETSERFQSLLEELTAGDAGDL